MLLACSLALAADALDARVGGKPFVPAAVLAAPEPRRPGSMWVLLTDQRASCDDLLAKDVPKSGTTLSIGFMEAKAGTTTREVYGFSDPVDGDARLVAVPDAAGGRGRIAFAVRGRKDRLEGEIEFELCAVVPPRPALVADLVPTERKLSEPSPFPDDPPRELTVRIGLPSGWTEVPPDDYVSYARWKAPDGFTRLSVSLQPPVDDFTADSASWAKMQLGAWDAPAEAQSRSDGPLGTGAYALYWTSRTRKDGPWTHNLDVFRQEPGWPAQVHCNLATDEAGAAVLVEPLKQACAAIERLP